MCFCILFEDAPTPDVYTTSHTLSLHDALPISGPAFGGRTRSRASRAFRPQPRISRAARRDLRRRSGLGGPLAEGSRPRPLRAIRLTRIGSITGKIGRAHV